MIQRIQTVYLFLGALALAALGFFDMPWASAAASTHAWFVPALMGLLVVTAGAALGAIFLHQTHEIRKTQRTVVVGVQVGTVLLAGVLYGGLYLTQELTFGGAQGIVWERILVLALPILAYLFFYLARRGIDHDVEVVERERQGRLR